MWGIDPLWFGLVEIGLGLIFCFVGQTAARMVLGVWGALIGFVTGNELYFKVLSQFEGVWSLIPWWVVAIALALLLAWLAFAFYTFGVLVCMGATGWGLGSTIAGLMGFGGQTSLLIGLFTALGLVLVGLMLNIPRLIIVAVTATIGAGAIVDGIQGIIGGSLVWTDQLSWQSDLPGHVAWAFAFLVLAGAGCVVQLRQKSDENLRDSYTRS